MAVRMYYGISGQPYSIFFIYPVFSCFYAERIFVRSAVLSCAGQEALGKEALGKEALGQEVLGQEALLWFLQSPGIPYVISL